MSLTVGVIKASLPSYFPNRHRVFERCLEAISELASQTGSRVVVAPDIPANGGDARTALKHCVVEGAAFILLIHGGFTMGDVAREIALSGLPMGVWATPEPNHTGDIQLNNFVSLNMSLSIARGVRDLVQNPVQWYFGAPDDPRLRSKLSRSLRALGAREALRGARVGVIGGLAPTFYNMEISGDVLTRSLGVEAVHVDIHRLTNTMDSFDDETVRPVVTAMRTAGAIKDISGDQVSLTGRAVLALRSITESGNFQGLAISDWPALQEYPGMHPGAAFSWLEETDNLPIASEGDVMGTVTQMVTRTLTGRVGSLLDMTSPQFGEDRILMWHGGGGPLYMAKDGVVEWINHPMIGRGTEAGPRYGAIADFQFAEGPHTVLRVARSGTAAFVVQGRVESKGETGFSGCRGWVTDFNANGHGFCAEDIVSTVMQHGLEHHFVLVPGSWASDFLEFAAWTGMRQLAVNTAQEGLPM